MDTKLFAELVESIQQADRIIKGEMKPARVTEFPLMEVQAIRAKTGLSQSGFAQVLGVSRRTLENWEQGRRYPTGPARTLLRIVDADPEFALRALHGNRTE
jgi:putative transcriptional regulator